MTCSLVSVPACASDWRVTIDRFIALEAFGSDHMREELKLLRDAVLTRGERQHAVLAEGHACSR
ncbi:MAG: hypothetical protein U1F19_08440 [Lysobacterales bacterium]